MKKHSNGAKGLEPELLSDRIRHMLVECRSHADFGRMFIRNALSEAAALLESGKQKDNSVDIAVNVNVRFVVPKQAKVPEISVPGPGDIDLCVYLCASKVSSGDFLACYSECNNPPPSGGIPGELPFQRCQRLWREFRQGNRMAFFELLQSGCIDFRQLVAALEPLMATAHSASAH